MRLTRKVVEESISESRPGKVVSDEADEGAADQGAVGSLPAGLLVDHSHEQVDVFHVLVSLLQTGNALKVTDEHGFRM